MVTPEQATIIASLGSAAFGLVGVVIANYEQSKKLSREFQKQSELEDVRLRAELDKHEAVTYTKLDELTREVREHNGFARRVPVIEEQIKVVNHRIEDLEKKTGA